MQRRLTFSLKPIASRSRETPGFCANCKETRLSWPALELAVARTHLAGSSHGAELAGIGIIEDILYYPQGSPGQPQELLIVHSPPEKIQRLLHRC